MVFKSFLFFLCKQNNFNSFNLSSLVMFNISLFLILSMKNFFKNVKIKTKHDVLVNRKIA